MNQQNGTDMAPALDGGALKPCPFCGSPARFGESHWSGHGEGGTLWAACCTGKDCGVSITSRATGYPYTQEKDVGCEGAALLWNRRV